MRLKFVISTLLDAYLYSIMCVNDVIGRCCTCYMCTVVNGQRLAASPTARAERQSPSTEGQFPRFMATVKVNSFPSPVEDVLQRYPRSPNLLSVCVFAYIPPCTSLSACAHAHR